MGGEDKEFESLGPRDRGTVFVSPDFICEASLGEAVYYGSSADQRPSGYRLLSPNGLSGS